MWFAACRAAGADDVREAARRGNEHYAAGRYAEALDAYAQATSQPADKPPPAELLHDRAAALFKLGRIAEARALWSQAKGLKDAAFEGRTEYNLGNCEYVDALAAAQRQDMSKALELLGQAAERYRDALRLDPTLADARANLELAQLLRRRIEEQRQNQPQSQPSSRPQSQPQSQPASQPGEQQSQSTQSTTSASSQPQSQPSSQPESQPDQQKENEAQEDQRQSQSPESQPQSDEQNDQRNAESQPASAESQPAEEQSAEQAPGVQMTREQAERLLQMVRDAEKARRDMLARQRMSRQKPVDRDW
jgi:tetratricopeptide (TPR) repeat protein